MARRKVNPDIGTCPCFIPGCNQTAAVRKQRSGELYLWCPDCQRIPPTDRLREFIIEKGHLWSIDENGQPVPPAEDPAQQAPAPKKSKESLKSETRPAPVVKPAAIPSRPVEHDRPASLWSRFWDWLWDWDL